MRFCLRATVLTIAVVLCTLTDAAALNVADVFGDHMVLQRRESIRVWGTADPGERIHVRLDENVVDTTTGEDGRWHVVLAPREAGGPFELVVEGQRDRLALQDVLIGEVWLASGQSNMEWTLQISEDPEETIAAADWPQIRVLDVPNTTAFAPSISIASDWQICSPQTAADFSGVAYHFSQRLHTELDVPVGIINASWGGTRIEPWTDAAHINWLISRLPDAAAQVVERGASTRDSIAAAGGLVASAEFEASVEALAQAEADPDVTRAQPGFDDSNWPTMALPGMWEERGLAGVDGMVWFRRRVEIPGAWAGKDLVLHLGPVDEADVTWFNGVEVGRTGSFEPRVAQHWDKPRHYPIDGSLVTAGQAVICVRAIDSAFAGGLWGAEPEEMVLARADGNGTLPIAGDWRYEVGARLAARPPATQQLPSTLYQAMIHPLVPLQLRGAIWYQGESNVTEGAAYTEKKLALVDSWRSVFEQPDLPFYFVQLAPFRYGDPLALPGLWEAQEEATKRRAGVANVPINDVGDLDDIHPLDKQTVGHRLADMALTRLYGVPGLVDDGPRLATVTLADDASVRVLLDGATGLTTRDGQPIRGFELAGSDGQFASAAARIDGEAVVVSSAQIQQPVWIRYGWDVETQLNLMNEAGWPATPFRSRVD